MSPDRSALRRNPLRLAAMAFALVAVTACDNDDNNSTTAPTPVDLDLGATSITLVRGQSNTRQLNVSVSGTTDQAVTYTVHDPGVATVSATGLITAVNDGSTFVTVRPNADPTKNRSVVVNVVSTIVTVTAPGTFTWVGGPTRTVSASVQNNTNSTVTWRSSNTAVATVSSTGVVTPVTAGSAVITAQSVGDPSKEASVTFTVDPAPITTATLITTGVGVPGLSAATGESRFFRIEVPTGATALTVATTGATSDIDIFVTAAALPTVSYSATPGSPTRCFAATASGNETCTITNPQSRVYYILIDAYEAYSNVTLTATVTRP